MMLSELINLLEQILSDRAQRAEHVKQLQQIVWNTINLHPDSEVIRILRDLAYDLDFFEPDDQVRADDPALYGDARLEEEIRSTLERLRSLPISDS